MRHVSPLAILAAEIPVILATSPAAATPVVQPFDQAAFDAARRAGKPILMRVHAPWCVVRRERAETIARLTADPAYDDMQASRIEGDTREPPSRRFHAAMQSTVIAFHRRPDRARIANETDHGDVSAPIHGGIARSRAVPRPSMPHWPMRRGRSPASRPVPIPIRNDPHGDKS